MTTLLLDIRVNCHLLVFIINTRTLDICIKYTNKRMDIAYLSKNILLSVPTGHGVQFSTVFKEDVVKWNNFPFKAIGSN